MPLINIHAAKTQLSRLVDAAAAGEDVVIARAGKPVPRLVPFHTPPGSQRRSLGILGGQLKVPADFDTPLPDEELDRFETPDAPAARQPHPAYEHSMNRNVWMR